MSGKEKEYVDVTRQPYDDAAPAYSDAPRGDKPMSKAEEAQAESSRVREDEG